MPSDFETLYLQWLPSKFLTPALRAELGRLARHMDAHGRIDQESGEVFVDEGSVRAMLTDFKGLPANFADGAIARLRALPDSRIRNGSGKKLKTVSWAELAAHIPSPEQSVPTWRVPTLENIRDAATAEDLSRILYTLFPAFPGSLLDGKAFQAHIMEIANAIAAIPSDRALVTVDLPGAVSCFLRHWGWWGTFIAIGIIIAIATALGLVVGPATVTVVSIAVATVSGYALAAVTALGPAAVIMLNCIINPTS